MILQQALKQQYHAGLAMLAECVEKCPDDLWVVGTPGRPFWRIAFHAVFFAHLYLAQDLDAYQPWPEHPEGAEELWRKPPDLEPYELPEDFPPYSKLQILDYIRFADSLIDPTVDTLDLDALKCGIPWYDERGDFGKLSHEILNIRHIQGHVGQLSELLMARGFDTNWISRR